MVFSFSCPKYLKNGNQRIVNILAGACPQQELLFEPKLENFVSPQNLNYEGPSTLRTSRVKHDNFFDYRNKTK